VAQQTLPGAAVDTLMLTGNAKGAFNIVPRVPEETRQRAQQRRRRPVQRQGATVRNFLMVMTGVVIRIKKLAV
jgi:hypothetical protein